jgi:hypothetical protein
VANFGMHWSVQLCCTYVRALSARPHADPENLPLEELLPITYRVSSPYAPVHFYHARIDSDRHVGTFKMSDEIAPNGVRS